MRVKSNISVMVMVMAGLITPIRTNLWLLFQGGRA